MTSLGREYGLVVARIDPVVLYVVGDIAAQSNEAAGARGLHHAARELLADQFATLARDGPSRPVTVDAGPPLAVRTAGAGSGSAGRRHETSERG